MTPILGIIASSISASLNASSYESIATTTVGAGGATSVTFSSIPATYKHLQIRFAVTGAASYDNIGMQVGTTSADTGSNYSYHQLNGDGASVAAGAGASTNTTYIGFFASNSGVGVVDILDYANTNKYKTQRSLLGTDNNGSGYVMLRTGVWMNTSAIGTIKITATVNQYSSFALYGIKG